MGDLFNREKFASLPREISTEGKRAYTYEVGDIVYWSPSSDVAIYYKSDREKIPNPGIIVIGKLDSGVESSEVRQSGSHVILRHPDGRRTTVPVHKGRDLGRGLLRRIMRDACLAIEDLSG